MAGRHFDTYSEAREHLLSEGFMPQRGPFRMDWGLTENGSNLWARIVPLPGSKVVLCVIETDYSLGLTDVEPA